MNVKKQLLVLLVWVLTIGIAVAGCSSGNSGNSSANDQAKGESSTADGNNQTDGESYPPLTFSYYINYDWFASTEWGADPVSKWIQDNHNVTVNYVSPNGAAAQKLNTMIAANKLADVIVTERGADVERLRQAGMLVPLDDYLDKYPNLKKMAGEKTLNMLRSDDGKLYQFPNWYVADGKTRGNSGWAINTKIYKALNSPKLETFKDLEAYLLQVKEKFPDVIPLEIADDSAPVDNGVIYAGFGEGNQPTYKAQFGYPDGDRLKSIFVQPEYAEYLKYMSKLFREKLIAQDAMTQTYDQLKEKMKNGRVAVLASNNVTGTVNEIRATLKQVDPDADFEMIWPIHKEGLDKNKIYPSNFDSLGWNVNVITTSAKDPERIFRFLDWATGEEGQRIICFGPQGLLWDEMDSEGVPIPNEKSNTMDQAEKDKLKLFTHDYVGNTTYVDTTKIKMEMMKPEEAREWAAMAQYNFAWKTAYNTLEFANINPLPDTEEGMAQTTIKENIYAESFAKALFAHSDAEVDQILAKAQKDAETAGIDKLLQYKTDKWHENLKKMSN